MIGNEADPDLTKIKNDKNETMKCLQRCEIQTEAMFTTTSSFPNRETFAHRYFHYGTIHKLRTQLYNMYDPLPSLVTYIGRVAYFTNMPSLNYSHPVSNLKQIYILVIFTNNNCIIFNNAHSKQ